MNPRRAFTEEQEQEIARRYLDGESARSLVRSFGGSGGSLRSALDRQGVRRRPVLAEWRDTPQETVDEMSELWAKGVLQVDIAKRFGIPYRDVSRLMRIHNKPRPPRRGARRGSENHGWAGGRITTLEGYAKVRPAAGDPLEVMADSSGYIPEHRLVMARAIGRPLRRDESVHHVNGDRRDNRLDNLQLRQSAHHGKGVAMRCLDCGSHNVGVAEL